VEDYTNSVCDVVAVAAAVVGAGDDVGVVAVVRGGGGDAIADQLVEVIAILCAEFYFHSKVDKHLHVLVMKAYVQESG